ncbi:hypothetical protein [Vibrio sp. 99K-1]|uniref:hypothetical protein n=1 Tax=Vibrio sp. 99K-1 TaxID=2607603 RepID=UPI001493C4EB|nr:hypothetical protein [Vibrio sp. 99K-1]NOI88801.1 hypothetical protein [Vibrio sp. 99K-1]
METFGSTYAKAVDDLSTKIFIPAIICSLIAEFGEYFVQNLGLVWGYIAAFFLGIIIGVVVVFFIVIAERLLGYNAQIKPYLGAFLMPLGLIGLFPAYFSGITPPYTQVTAVALLAWSFVLIKPLDFFRYHLDMRSK